MLPAITGAGLLRFTVIDCELLSPQLFLAITERVPPEEPALTVIVFVPCPEFMVSPEVAVQAYEVAFVIAGNVYEWLVVFAQTPVGPVIEPVITGAGLDIVNVLLATPELVPQSFDALTVIDPEPEVPAVTCKVGLVVIRLGAENPDGSVQL